MYDWRIVFYAFSLTFSTILSLVVSLLLWKRRKIAGAIPMALVMAAVAIWSSSNAIEATAVTLSEKILWSKLSYIGIVCVTPLFFQFTLQYTSAGRRNSRWLNLGVWAVPVIILALVFTNEAHALIWSGFEWIPGTTILLYQHGLAFWVNIAYIYALLSISSGALILNAIRNRNIYRDQAITVLIGVPIPLVWSILYVAGLSPLAGFDLTPVAFALSGLVITWGLYRSRLFDIAPVESEFIIENLGDGVIILDAKNRIVQINPAAQRLLLILTPQTIGEDLFQLVPELDRFSSRSNQDAMLIAEVEMNPGNLYLEYQSHRLQNPNKGFIGQTIILRDITARKMAEFALRESEQRYQDLIEQASLPVMIIDQRSFDVIFYNRRAGALLDISSRFNRGLKLEKYFTQKGELQRIFNLVQKNGLVSDYEAQMTTQVGRTIWVVASANLTHYESRQAIFLSFNDITARKLVEESEKQERVFAQALSASVSALNSTLNFEEVLDRILINLEKVIPNVHSNIMLVDEDGVANIVRARGYDASVLERLLEQVHLRVSETPTLLRMAITGTPLVVTDTDGDPIWSKRDQSAWIRSYLGAPIHVKGKVVGYINLDSDQANMYNRIHTERLQHFANQAAIAIENARLFEKVEQMAIIDTLTGLYNRRHFYELGDREFERYKRYKNPFSLILLDLDHFKDVNDRYGHAAGDQVLHGLFATFSESLRKMDIPGRIGGEEFIILLPETNLEHAMIAAERLRKTIELSISRVEGYSIRITASMGVVSAGENYSSLQEMISLADQAMYKAKANGRNRVISIE